MPLTRGILLAATLYLVACGRIGYDPVDEETPPTGDASIPPPAVEFSCPGAATTPPSFEELPGTYALVQMDGRPLPARLMGFDVTDGVLIIEASGDWSSTMLSPGQPNSEDEGTLRYVAADGSAVFVSTQLGRGNAARAAGDELTVAVPTMSGDVCLVYRRAVGG